MADEMLTKEEVCRRLHVKARTLDQMIAAGAFPAGNRFGRKASPVWDAEIVRDWLKLYPLLPILHRWSDGKAGEGDGDGDEEGEDS